MIQIINNSGLDYQLVTFTDVIEPNLAILVPNSVLLNDVTVPYEYEQATGLLSLNIETINDGDTANIVFKVVRNPDPIV